MQRSQQYFIAGGLGVLAVLILSFAVILASSLGPDMSNTAPTAITQPTNTPHRTPTPDTLHVSPAQGWVSATTLPFGKSIAFARSAPLTGYACGNTATDGFTTDLLLWSITHDGGRTWSSPTQTSSRGSMCDININPSNAQDVVLHGLIVCPLDDCAVAQADPFYVSHDGGTSWQELLLPHASALQAPLVFSQIWAGNALFITGLKSSANASDYELSVSINGGPMQDLDLNKTFAGINGASLGFNSYFFATTSTFGIRAAVPGCISLATTPLCPMVTTSDHGATWQHFIPSGDAPSTFIVLGGDGQTLLGGLSQSVTTSSDGGRTWTALTSSSYPTAITDSTITLSSMPDGTLYISGFLTSAEHMAVYRFSPSTAKWQYIATAPGWQTLATSWDVNGHAVATWAQTGVIARRVLPPGIAYHAATP